MCKLSGGIEWAFEWRHSNHIFPLHYTLSLQFNPVSSSENWSAALSNSIAHTVCLQYLAELVWTHQFALLIHFSIAAVPRISPWNNKLKKYWLDLTYVIIEDLIKWILQGVQQNMFHFCFLNFSASYWSRNSILDIFQQPFPYRFWKYPFFYWLVKPGLSYFQNTTEMSF